MNSEKIIEADRNFVRKLHQLRSKLNVRQKENEKRPSAQVFPRSMVLTLMILMITGAGYAILHNRQGEAPVATGKRTAQDQNAQVPQSRPPTEMDERRFESKSRKNRPTVQETTASPDKRSHASSESDGSKIEGVNERLPSVESEAPVVDMKNIELVSTVVCRSVKDRSPIDEQQIFYPSDTSRAYVWMAARSKAPPFVIQHIYYLNGRKYCEVPLEIKHSWMRTWSYVTLGTKKQAGEWRVEIVSDDRVLETLGFIVKDGDDRTR